MAKRMLIKVTERDIRDGSPRHSQFCPVAYALRRQVPGAKLHPVHVGAILAEVAGTMVSLSERAQRFIKRYDNPKFDTVTMKPFSFWLSLPDSALRKGSE